MLDKGVAKTQRAKGGAVGQKWPTTQWPLSRMWSLRVLKAE